MQMHRADTGRQRGPKKEVASTCRSRPEKRKIEVFNKKAVQESNKRMSIPAEEDLRERSRRERSASRMRERPSQIVVPGLRSMLKANEKKRQKAKQRQGRFVKRLRASKGEMSILEMSSVKEPQRRDYSRRLDAFYEFVGLHQIDIHLEEGLDAALCDFADHLYLNGEGADAGWKLKAALEFVRPEAMRRSDLFLPRFRRALKGWRKMAPGQTRLPMLEFVKSCISGLMMFAGQRQMALFNELTFSTYARPGEALRITCVDVVRRNNQFNFHVVVLAPFERGEMSKTGIFDEVLIMDDVRLLCLGDVMVQEAARKQALEGEDSVLWDFTAQQYLKVWRQCVEILEVSELAISPYQNRHGGASRDHLLKLRSVAQIQRRGRWATDTSARIYDKPGRLQQMVNKFHKDLEPLGEICRTRFQEFFSGKPFPLPAKLKAKAREIFKM